jgi:hypothetical protein
MEIKTYNVLGVMEKFSKVVEKNGELYFPIEAFDLTVRDVMDLIVEVGGDILVGASKSNDRSGVLVSETAIGAGLIYQGIYNADEFSKLVIELKEKLKETEGAENNGNEK